MVNLAVSIGNCGYSFLYRGHDLERTDRQVVGDGHQDPVKRHADAYRKTRHSDAHPGGIEGIAKPDKWDHFREHNPGVDHRYWCDQPHVVPQEEFQTA